MPALGTQTNRAPITSQIAKDSEGSQLEQAMEVLINVAEATVGHAVTLDQAVFGMTPEPDKPRPSSPVRNGLVLSALDRIRNVTHTLEVANQQLIDTNQRLR